MRKLRSIAITAFILFITFIAAILIIPFVANSDVGSQWLWQKGNLGTPLGSDKIYIERKSDNLGLVRGLSLDDHYNWLTGKLVVWPMGNCKTAKTEAELIALKDDAEIVVVQAPITLTANLTTTCGLYITRGCPITTAGNVLTENGPHLSDGAYQQYVAVAGEVVFGTYVTQVRPEWWETSTSDSTTAMNTAAFACGSTKTLKLGARTYTVTTTSGNYAVTASCAIKGESPNLSIIHNTGAGSALLIDSVYYGKWENFSVTGNASSEDGITISGGGNTPHEVAYGRFVSVDSTGHGRHGLRHRMGWATKYYDCKFSYNGGLGVYILGDAGDYGGAGQGNGILFSGCEARWNGGTADASSDFLKGGIRVIGGQAVTWLGGVIEANNAWGIIYDEETTVGSQVLSIDGVYFENHPLSTGSSTTGGHIRAGGYWNNLSIQNCILPTVALPGVTSYAYYIVKSSGYAEVHIRNNRWYAAGGGGTETESYLSGNLIGYMKFGTGSNLAHHKFGGTYQTYDYGQDPTLTWEGNYLTLQTQNANGYVDLKKSVSGNHPTRLRAFDAADVATVTIDPAYKGFILKDTVNANFYYLTINGGVVTATVVP